MKSWTRIVLGLAVLLAGAALLVGCSSENDDPKESGNRVTIDSFSPSNACVDYDGELIDTDGDGTLDTVVFVDTVNTVNFASRVRGSSTSAFQDVIFTEMDVIYEFSAGTPPPDRLDIAINVTVPVNGTATLPVVTVLAQDAAVFFDGATRGNVRLRFRGEDASGKPYSTSGAMEIRSVTLCGGL